MNRAKQLEALRGMKFMQRKEEAIRREVISTPSDDAGSLSTATETAVVTASAAANPAAAASTVAAVPVTTILMEDRFDPLSHNMGRKRFMYRPQQPIIQQQQQQSAGLEGGQYDESGLWDSVAPLATSGGNMISMNEPLDDANDDSAMARAAKQQQGNANQNDSGMSGRRFTIKESVRAPPMPRRLEEAMHNGSDDAPDTKRLRAEFGIGAHTNEERGGDDGEDDE